MEISFSILYPPFSMLMFFAIHLLMMGYYSLLLAASETSMITDQSVLLALKSHITSDPHNILTKNWTKEIPVCNWIGVTCTSRHDRVAALDISGMSLNGTIPPEIGNLSFLVSLNMSRNSFHGNLPEKLVHLHRLRTIDLSSNWLTGEIPKSWFGSLLKLQFILLNDNFLQGNIPQEIGKLPKLKKLSLGLNNLTGPIPPSIFNMSSLEVLSLEYNLLLSGGRLPGGMCNHSLCGLRELKLAGNNFYGEIPSSLDRCSQLEVLSLEFNHLTGHVPPSIFNMSSLQVLSLGNNYLLSVGRLPDGMCNSTYILRGLRELDLERNDLYGEIPSSLGQCSHLESLSLGDNYLTGHVPPSIFNYLSSLTYLNLANNNLSGSLPIDMCTNGHLQGLTYLFLSQNMFDGEIPPSLGHCSELQRLILDDNGFRGSVPRELGNLTQLEVLFLGNNSLTGPVPPSIFNMSSLTDLVLYKNSLSGNLPIDMCIHGLQGLTLLYLSENMFDGKIPQSLYQCSQLWEINLSYNQFAGDIPTEIWNVTKLVYLTLSGNSLSGEIFPESQVSRQGTSGIPSELRSLIASDNQLSGDIPWELFTVNITSIDLSNNTFKGSMSLDIGRKFPNLDYLNLARNNLSGPIPSTIGSLLRMSSLMIHSNKLTGEIPPSICNMTSLEYLHLSHNNLEGLIPHCVGNFSRPLQVLHLKENHFHGLIPASFSESCSLQSLNLNGNNLKGPLPKSIVNCAHLQVLDVGNNEIQDMFPFWTETLLELRVLILKSNRFFGTTLLASNTSKVTFPKLQVFDISRNGFAGSLPERYLENFIAMINVVENITEKQNWFSSYEESMTFVLKGTELSVERILTAFTYIDLSDNKFNGSIPQSIGKLNSLRYLNLSHNILTGHIPSSLGNVAQLESLDLSSNQLGGEIPWQLTPLTFLSKLNLSSNNLVGRIPQSSGQFPTFDNSSYMENSGLCGFPLTKTCKEDNLRPSFQGLPQKDLNDESDFFDGFTWQVVLLGYGCGFVFGATVSYFAFRYQKPKWFVDLFCGVAYLNWGGNRRNATRRRT